MLPSNPTPMASPPPSPPHPKKPKVSSSPSFEEDQGEDEGEENPTPRSLRPPLPLPADSSKPRYKRRKVAIFFAYCGFGYQGMQKNPGAKTIESDLEDALYLSFAVPESDHGLPRRYDWARSARTDKGVSAAGQVVSGRFYVDPPGLVNRLNSHLPPQIRIFGYKRATASFNAKKFCDRRRYVYLLPVFALDPEAHPDRESVMASLGSGNELAKCLECLERGRKVPGVMGQHVKVGGEEEEEEGGREKVGENGDVGFDRRNVEVGNLGERSELDDERRPFGDDGVDKEKVEVEHLEEGSELGTEKKTIGEDGFGKEKVEVGNSGERLELGIKRRPLGEDGYDGVDDKDNVEIRNFVERPELGNGCSTAQEGSTCSSVALESEVLVESMVAEEKDDDALITSEAWPVVGVLSNSVSVNRRFEYGEKEKERFNGILKRYVGTHNFHNFTTRTKAEDPSARRYIVSFDANSVVKIDGIDFVKCEVVGQSFMLHQIRKMIGLAVAIMRNCTPEIIMDSALRQDVRINVPTAPEVGLYLEECLFASYNQKWKDSHEELSMCSYATEAEDFKMKYIYSHIASMEQKEGSVALWLHSLNHRNYPDLRYEGSKGNNDAFVEESFQADKMDE